MTAQTRSSERVLWADTARGIAIGLVAIYHATNWLLAAGLPITYWSEINEALSTLRMPLFFAVAGLFAGKWLSASWRDLWSTKLSLFVWVFLLWEAIGSAALYLGLIMQDRCCGVKDTAIAFLLSPLMPRFELWFIWALAIFFIVARLTRRLDPRLQLGIAALASAIALSGWTTTNIGWSGSVKYYVFFLVGLYARDTLLAVGRRGGRLTAVALVAIWAAVSVTVWAVGLREVPGVYFLNCLIGVIGGISLARLLSGFGWLRAIGRQTLPIYLAHTPIILVVAFALWVSPLRIDQPVAAVVPPAVAAIAVALSWLLHGALAPTPLRYLYTQPSWLARPGPERHATSPAADRTTDPPAA